MKKLKLINKWSFLYLISSLILGVSIVASPISLKYVVEAIQNDRNIWVELSIFVISSISIISVNIFNFFIIKKIEITYEQIIKKSILKHYANQKFQSFHSMKFENWFLFDSPKIISDYMFAKLKIIFFSIATLIVVIGISYISIIMLPIILFLNLLTMFINRFLQRKSSKLNLAYSKNRKNYLKKIEDLLLAYNDASSMSSISNLKPKFLEVHKSYDVLAKKLIPKEASIFGIKKLLFTISSLLTWISLSFLTRNESISISSFIVFIGFDAHFSMLLQGFISNLYLSASSKDLIQKIFQNVEFDEEMKIINPFPIQVQNFTFNTKNGILKFNHININSYDKIILKGPNGSGKSIFLKILSKQIPNEKEVLFNKERLNTITVASFTRYLSTKPIILNCSIVKNILLENNLEIEKNFKKRYAFLFQELPNPNTNALNLSHGQKQIVCLLRSLWQNPKLLIIDEGISAIAQKVLYKIEKTLFDIPCAVIYVSHQVSTNFKYNKRILRGANE